jgi:hypothetical protein
MPFDPNIPGDADPVIAPPLRAQFNSLKALIDGQAAQITALSLQVTGQQVLVAALQTQITALNTAIAALANLVPIGAILPWAKNSFNAVLTLPENFLECNGQTVNDGESPMDGEALPDLTGRFLRGAALSGDSGGADSHTHDVDLGGSSAGDPGASGGSTAPLGTYATTSASTLPPYYEVVLVMRIK